MKITLQLEDFALTSLRIDWALPPMGEMDPTGTTELGFDYKVATHHSDPWKYRMTFQAAIDEKTGNGEPQGYRIRAEIIGYFRLDPEVPEAKRDAQVLINGVSQLYSTLRGVIATATGSFAGDKFVMPSIMPQDLVRQVEENRARRLAEGPSKAAGDDGETTQSSP